jgi:hypothetical protein
MTRADREIEEGDGGAALPAAPIPADHEPAAGGVEAVDVGVRYFEDMEVGIQRTIPRVDSRPWIWTSPGSVSTGSDERG